jgi:hypothetical protein
MNRQRLRYLGIISISIVLIGSLVSVVLVLLAGRNNTSGLLRILFCGWVLLSRIRFREWFPGEYKVRYL